MEISRIGNFSLGWGESLVWDDKRARLYFVDCAAQTLHWLDDGSDDLRTLRLPSMPTGIVPTDTGDLVCALDDGLYAVDPDAGTNAILTRYPERLGGRCNDACADLSGNLITGKLNLGPAEGSVWWYSRSDGWRLIDPDIANTNGPAVGVLDGVPTLIVGDTAADYFSYPYDAANGVVGPRSIFGDVSALEGHPDGATLDADGGLWCALYAGGQIVRFTTKGLARTISLPVINPTDLTFGGRQLDRLFVVSTGVQAGTESGLNGALLVIDGLDVRGRREPRFTLADTRPGTTRRA